MEALRPLIFKYILISVFVTVAKTAPQCLLICSVGTILIVHPVFEVWFMYEEFY